MIMLGATDSRARPGFCPIAVGLGLTLIHLIGIPVTNLSVNPCRTGPSGDLVALRWGLTTELRVTYCSWGGPAASAIGSGKTISWPSRTTTPSTTTSSNPLTCTCSS
jgi:aquaporin Z